MGQFFEELKRRNVLRVAAAYVVVSWLIIQVVETIFPVFGLGDAGIRFVIIVLAIGLIPALILSWAFEITPEGLKKEKDVDRSESVTAHTGKKLDRWIMAVLVVALGYFAIDKFALSPQREAAQQQQQAEQLASATEEARQEGRSQALTESYGDKSIAVLPFADMSPMHDQEYMSDGIAEELLNLLVKIPELRVISRTSAFAFKGKDIDIPTIAEHLNVAHILEGSVRKSGDRIRITAQLIEARSDTHLWSETYDRVLDDIFAIQDEISAAIASALKIQLLGNEDAQTGPITANAEAYDAFLRGLRASRVGNFDSLENAIALLDTSIQLDPSFAPAYVTMAQTRLQQNDVGAVPTDVATQHAETAVQHALLIDPDSGPAHAANGAIAFARRRADEAIEHYSQAMTLGELSSEGLLGMAQAQTLKGDFEQALSFIDRAAARDPLNENVYFWRGNVLYMQGLVTEAIQSYLEAARIEPAWATAPALAGVASGVSLGDVATTSSALLKAVQLDPADPEIPAILVMASISLGDRDGAKLWADRAIDLDANSMLVVHTKVRQLLYAGDVEMAVEFANASLANPDVEDRRGFKADVQASVLSTYFRNGDFIGAEGFLLGQYPNLPQLLDMVPAKSMMDLAPADGQIIVVQALANVFRETGREREANRLSEHLRFIDIEQIHRVSKDLVIYYGCPG